jgi:hypothetical protein
MLGSFAVPRAWPAAFSTEYTGCEHPNGGFFPLLLFFPTALAMARGAVRWKKIEPT